MDPLDAVEELARRARFETAPPVRVNLARVLEDARRQRSLVLPLRWSAAISAVAACIVVTSALCWTTTSARATSTKSTTTDSVDALFAPVKVEMP